MTSTERAGQAALPPRVADGLAAVLVAAAFVVAAAATHDLDWPGEVDFFRDMGASQALLDGAWLADPGYRGETRWYSPLVPGLIAAVSVATDVELPVLYARAGAYLNLLCPLAFYVMVRLLFGPWVALASLASYLFLGNPERPSYVQATYSPWLWPSNTAQCFFYATVSAWTIGGRSERRVWDVVTGTLLGLTFLAHAAPGLIGALLVTISCAGAWRRDREGQGALALRRLATIGFTAALVSLPFIAPLWLRYGLQVVHSSPLEYVGIAPAKMLADCLSLRTAVAAVGGVVLLTGRAGGGAISQRSFALFAWLTLGLLAYGLGADRFAWWWHLAPTHHFHLYAKAAESVLFGVGLLWLARALADRASRPALVPAGVATVLLLWIGIGFGPYRTRPDFTVFPDFGRQMETRPAHVGIYAWALRDTAPDDVIFSDPHTSLYSIASAGRKVVCLPPRFSNPYVDYRARCDDATTLSGSLERPDSEAFVQLAAKYGLHYVVAPRARQVNGAALKPVARIEDFVVYRYSAH